MAPGSQLILELQNGSEEGTSGGSLVQVLVCSRSIEIRLFIILSRQVLTISHDEDAIYYMVILAQCLSALPVNIYFS